MNWKLIMGQSRTTTEQSIPQWQEDFLRQTVMPAGQNIADTPFTAYGGQFAPQISPYTTQAGQTFGQVAGMTPQDFQAQTASNFSAMRENVLDPQVQAMARQRAQAITGEEANIARAGAFGSRGDVYQGEAQGAYEAGVANLMAQGYNQAQAANMAQQAAQQQAAGGLLGVGAADTALGMADVAGQYGEFQREQQYPYQQFGALSGFGAGNYGGTTTQQRTPGLFDYLTAGFTGLSYL